MFVKMPLLGCSRQLAQQTDCGRVKVMRIAGAWCDRQASIHRSPTRAQCTFKINVLPSVKKMGPYLSTPRSGHSTRTPNSDYYAKFRCQTVDIVLSERTLDDFSPRSRSGDSAKFPDGPPWRFAGDCGDLLQASD